MQNKNVLNKYYHFAKIITCPMDTNKILSKFPLFFLYVVFLVFCLAPFLVVLQQKKKKNRNHRSFVISSLHDLCSADSYDLPHRAFRRRVHIAGRRTVESPGEVCRVL